MHDGANSLQPDEEEGPVSIDEAIVLLETGQASESLCVDLGNGLKARGDGHLGLSGLLQRLRGYKFLQSLAASSDKESVVPMRSGIPDMHPQVEIILDALKNRP